MKATSLTLVAALICTAGLASAQDFKAHLKARQGQFRIMALSLGELGAMAKGEKEYSEAAASAAANSLAGIAMVDQTMLWVPGSDNMAIDGTRAQPSIWDNNADFLAKWAAFQEAAAAAPGMVTGGRESLGPVLGKIGATCKSCHEAHRAPAN